MSRRAEGAGEGFDGICGSGISPAPVVAPAPGRRPACGWLLPALLLTVLLALMFINAPRARALVYWVNYGNDTIGRANLNGSGADQSFIQAPAAYGIAVNDRHIYWSTGVGWIGRANLNGTGVRPMFIPTALPTGDSGVAIDDRHVYWANGSFGWIGRAKLNGEAVDQMFLPPQSQYVRELAVNGRFLYWADSENSRIGRAELSTGGVDPLFIHPTSDSPEGVAVDGGHIYWSNSSGDTLGRARLNGTRVDQSFIPADYAYGVEVDGGHVYWANYGTDSIGRAKLNGSGVRPGFIAGADDPQGLAVDWIVNPGTGFRITKVKSRGKSGTAKLTIKVPGPGILNLHGRGFTPMERLARRARATLTAIPRGSLKRKLAHDGKANAKLDVTFRPNLSNGSKTKTVKVRLRKR